MKNSLLFTLLIISACTAKEQQNIKTHDGADTAAGKTVNFLWRENQYDAELKDTVNTIVINEAFCKNMSDAEKAALGFVGTFIGSECWWDGEAKEDRSNLKCKILTSLNLGYQCSEQHIGFLKQWFKNDKTALEKLNDCPTIPYTATIQETFNDIRLTTKGDKITVWYAASGVNLREEQEWDWTEEITFQVNGNDLNIIEQKSSRE
ncbi:MAG: hypothetical protein ACK4TA_02120 [Saprospiraceae bacterium]